MDPMMMLKAMEEMQNDNFDPSDLFPGKEKKPTELIVAEAKLAGADAIVGYLEGAIRAYSRKDDRQQEENKEMEMEKERLKKSLDDMKKALSRSRLKLDVARSTKSRLENETTSRLRNIAIILDEAGNNQGHGKKHIIGKIWDILEGGSISIRTAQETPESIFTKDKK